MLQSTFLKYYNRKSTSTKTGKDNATVTGSLHSMANSSLSANEDMSACFSPTRNDYVYKRRRKHENYVTPFTEKIAVGSTKIGGSCPIFINSSEQLSLVEQRCEHLDSRFEGETERFKASIMPVESCKRDIYPWNPDTILSPQINDSTNVNTCSKSDSFNRISTAVEKERFSCTVRKSALEYYTSANDSCSSSKSNVEHGLSFAKTEGDDTAECSSSDIVSSELLQVGPLKREPSVLTRSCSSVDIVGVDGEISCSICCKICGLLDSSLKMLICDLCEEAFHLACCNPQVKEIPLDEWYCRFCMKKKPKPLLQTITPGKSLNIMSGTTESRKRALQNEFGPIMFMLKDTEPYTTGVRIGKAFQADVPDWSAPISEDSDKFGEALDLDPSDSISLNVWNSNQSSTRSSIGNWLQCREIIENGGSNDGVICGKWRRAPLFEVQTDDWDCSCAVVWDPIHADCAVPQELGTDEVMMHLKYIELLRPKLAARKLNLNRTRIGGCD